MKILQINKFFFLKGGSERYFFDLSELLFKKGHEVIVWSTQNPKNLPWPRQENFAEFSDFSKKQGLIKDFKKVRRIFWNKEAKRKLEKIIKEVPMAKSSRILDAESVGKKPDIAHLHNIFSHLSPSIIFALKKHGIPIVMTLHDYKLFCPNYQFFSQGETCFDCLKKKNYSSCISKKCIKNSRIKSLIGYLEAKSQRDFLKVADKINIFLTPSMFMKRKAIEWGIPNEKVIHLPNFIDENYISKKSENKKQSNYFLYFGRLSHEKGVKLLIKAFSKTKDELSDWQLKIVGDGPEKERLKNLAKEQKRIEFLGGKKGKELKEIIINANLVVIPSIWPENFPYSALESFALSKPVIAAKNGGLTELIKDRKTGLLFKSGNEKDLIEKLIWANDYKEELKQMGKTAKKEVLAQYNPEKHYQKLIKVYERIKNN
ncbi:MAG: glycosyltransferase family 4 protein [Parcubacteria group bacterium]|nr:glycosyltransferase family 4 protein [Parcubacteria group bacterium]